MTTLIIAVSLVSAYYLGFIRGILYGLNSIEPERMKAFFQRSKDSPAQFISPTSFKEKFTKANNITDLLNDE